MENFSIEVDKDGIALVTWDMPGRSMNVISESVMRELSDLVDRFQKDDAIKGVVLTSGKSSFCAGADLEMLESLAIETAKIDPDNTEQVKTFFDNTFFLNSIFRRMETCGKPVVAALTGTALGGGLEAALATHYRISVEDDRAKIGLPEALVGLLPGGGGTQRLPRMISVGAALPLIIQGQQISPKKAHEMGIINKLVSSQDELIPEAKKWILNEGTAEQPWDQKGYKVPGGNPYHPAANQNFIVGTAMLREKTFGNYPAQSYIMSCVYEGTLVPIDAGLRIESRYFAKLLMRSEARNMIRSIFMSKGELEKGARRPQGVDETHTEKVGILGAGLMGAGVAYVSAMAGIKVVLLDRDQEAAEKGKSYSTGLLEKRVSKGRMTEAKRDEILSLIHPTTDYADLKDCDLIIEAVFENSEIKAEVTKKTEAQIAPDAVFGTNTSTIPITDLAEASERPDNFIGIHFFSPVDKMMLVEIILGEKTGDYALAKALDYTRQIKKTPIVVNDSRGFYTSRCVGVYVNEGIRMLTEGVKPALIENAGKMAGMPVAPLALNDEVAIDLSHKIRTQYAKDLGDAYEKDATDEIVAKMVEELGRYGKKNKKGFYEYPEDGKKFIWPGLTDLVTVANSQPDVAHLQKRILYSQAIETARCFEENVLTDVRDADVGAILGWGFAPYTGGPLSFIDTVGLKAFVAECEKLAEQHGPRFEPTPLLREMAERGETFYTRFNPKAAPAAAAE